PSLFCKYRVQSAAGPGSFQSLELVPGVENFQVLYGVSSNRDTPDGFVRASDMQGKDWQNIVAIKIALGIRADTPGQASAATQGAVASIALFGPGYVGPNSTYTPTTDVHAARRLYGATVQIRNALACAPDLKPCI